MTPRYLVLTLALPLFAQPPLRMSMRRAVELAVSPEGNANIRIAGESVKQAQARASQARSALLPDVESSVTYQDLTRNLAALGVRVSIPIPGFSFPTFVGPFNVFDARATINQSVFD